MLQPPRKTLKITKTAASGAVQKDNKTNKSGRPATSKPYAKSGQPARSAPLAPGPKSSPSSDGIADQRRPGKPAATDAAAARPVVPASLSPSSSSNAPSAQPNAYVHDTSGIEYLDIKADSLAFSLVGAAQAVAYVLDGVALPQALAKVFTQSKATPQIKGAIQDISYRTMRQVGRVDALLTLMTTKAPEPALLYGLLCCALTLLVKNEAEEDQELPYEAFVVVDQAVNAAASSSHMAHAKNMVNAILRRFLREQDSLLATVIKQPAALWNYPQWWIDQCKAAYPDQWQAILRTGNQHPPMTLRVNRRQITTEAYLLTLASEHIEAIQIGPYAVRLTKPVPVAQIPGFEQGWVSVQDAGAQLSASLLDVQDGMRVLDACAAPGGKSCHILETANVDLLALDADPQRLGRIDENLARLQLSAEVKEGDASRSGWWDKQGFDRILADIPCTASGVVRRHPDIRWLRRKADAVQLSTLSARILDNLWRMLKPEGKLLLVTCSIWPMESELQAAAFAKRHNAIRLDAPGQLLPTAILPNRITAQTTEQTAEQATESDTTSAENNDHDGLFYALFQKPAA
ncbi:16S rRNA (cytosine(967)-C(5))-methyltransferase RsmB [Undibacterium sp. RTI2.1]|uniref:16S rRNA (cytosine(967)-C(5))-methyltransferase RsmB n=1 Tax=unclassified Undibacterium TaxID=2630295 RepID=UPI002B233604|nr:MULTISPECIES: 16S rRNA (cytosine(967)-C(5))-methyltransferase RsmB [unclassified Undibacterium]MEB0029667.1 16S rRNA (cytosine(967)-C(5))-methyltransferase RsmB [Undibacterium sp. RTI2.1]MEB0116138.1 16S rRNA (cytosine(967)-C(5))-methyltransferase RsmB [Undibacterium sp. RTI2.2]